MNLKLIFTFILLNFIYQAIAGSGDRCEDPINMECVFVDEVIKRITFNFNSCFNVVLNFSVKMGKLLKILIILHLQ